MGNERLVGATLKPGAIAVPVSGTECGLPAALSVMLIAADLLPGDFGASATLKVTLLPGATDAGSVPVASVKSAVLVPVRLAAEICSGAVPELVITTGVFALVVFTSCGLLKATLVGAIVMPGAIALPEMLTACGLPAALSVRDSDADFAPGVVGANVTLMVVLALGATLIGSVLDAWLNCEASVPVNPMAVMVRVAVPLLVTTTGV